MDIDVHPLERPDMGYAANCSADVPGQKRAAHYQTFRRGIRLGQRGGETKNPPAKECSEGLRKTFWETQQLFSSFLRGASRPKSPRHAATAASSFMQEKEGGVKGELW